MRSPLVLLVQVLHVLVDFLLNLGLPQLLLGHVSLLAYLPSPVRVALALLHVDREPLSRLQPFPEVKQVPGLPHVPRRVDEYVR